MEKRTGVKQSSNRGQPRRNRGATQERRDRPLAIGAKAFGR
ncbi:MULTISPECIES: hypothetical protein [unclassified Limnothrix]|nr:MULTISPECIES: hypothetical protein [unclassified Limnothrix]